MLAKYVEKLWKTGLVHGDLSEFNIMMLREKPYIIDIGQAVSTESPIAKELLNRDLHNLQRLAEKYKIIFDAEKAFGRIISFHS
jgi:serine/threonine-protein kinase RIO1